jgi:lysophospholipase L1-like esterase
MRPSFLIATLIGFSSSCLLAPVGRAQQTVRDPEPWEREIAAFEAADRVNPPPKNAVLFVGSSTIRLWPTLAADFPGVSVIQRGFGGTDFHLVNYYAPRIVLPYRPRMIVVYAGDNDLAAGLGPKYVLEQFKTFVSEVRHALPHSKIAFVSIKPSPERWALADSMRVANELIRRYAATVPGVSYVDVFNPMLDSRGLPNRELYSPDDLLHMNAKGYALWRRILAPLIRDSTPSTRPMSTRPR